MGFSVIIKRNYEKGVIVCDETDYQLFADYDNIAECVKLQRICNGNRAV